MSPVLLLAPQVFSALGGVQSYMRFLVTILADYAAQTGDTAACLALHDTSMGPGAAATHIHFIGARRSKIEFLGRAAWTALRQRPATVVVGHIGLAPAAWLLQRLRLIPSYVLVLHGVEAWDRLNWLQRKAASAAVWTVATTKYTALKFCRSNEVPLERLRVIPLAVPRTPAAPANGLAAAATDAAENGKDLHVLTVGRWAASERYKGVDTLIDAVGLARAECAQVRLTIVGNGDDVPRLRARVDRLSLQAAVRFEGAIPNEPLDRLYRECDVLALPSKKEGFGIVFLEAMRYGKPCIGGAHGGTPEVIDHGVDGFLVDHGDAEQLTRCLIELSEKPQLRRQMGHSASLKVETKFNFCRMEEDWFVVLDETVAG